MGSFYEINDTLLLTRDQGFPSDVFCYEKHVKNPVTLDDVKDRVFSFHGEPNARVYQLDPVRVYLIEHVEEDIWLGWGQVYIQSLELKKLPDTGNASAGSTGQWVTSGTYKVVEVYDPEYQRIFNAHEVPPQWDFFRHR